MKLCTLPLFAALSLMLAGPLTPMHAQMPVPHGTPRQDPGAALSLTPAQKAQIQALLLKAGPQMRAISLDQSLAPAVRMAKMRAIGQSITSQMMALLTPAQRVKAKAMMQRAQAAGRQHNQGTLYRYRFEDFNSPTTRIFNAAF